MPSIEIAEVKRLDVRPGDTLVVKVPSHLSQEQQARVSSTCAMFWPDARVIVDPIGLEYEIVPAA